MAAVRLRLPGLGTPHGQGQLGFGILRLASSIPGRLSVVREARDVLESLAARDTILKTVGLPARTPRTVTNRAQLEKQLLEISRQGYAVIHEEFEIGLSAVAVPIWNHLGNVIAAVSISGPAFRFTPEEDPGLIEGLRAAGLSISAKMGYRHR